MKQIPRSRIALRDDFAHRTQTPVIEQQLNTETDKTREAVCEWQLELCPIIVEITPDWDDR